MSELKPKRNIKACCGFGRQDNREIAEELKDIPATVAQAYVSWDIEELTKEQIIKKYKNYRR